MLKTKTAFLWVQSNSSIRGNEKAYKAAMLVSLPPISYNNLYSIIKQKIDKN